MPKSINWSEEFYNEVINEEVKSFKIALRPGSLYADNNYFRKNDIVDIRINHKIVRKALVCNDTIIAKIEELPDNIISLFKSSYQSRELIIEFLKKTYNKPINKNSIVTIIPYINLPLTIDKKVDDPHM